MRNLVKYLNNKDIKDIRLSSIISCGFDKASFNKIKSASNEKTMVFATQ